MHSTNRRFRLAIAFVLLAGQVRAAECGLSPSFRQPDVSHAGNSSPVWKTSSPGPTTVLFRHALQVNTDGTRRSYSVEDFWGERRAINNLCNAMSDSCSGLDQAGLRNRRLVTQQALSNHWPAAQLAATRIDSQIISFTDGKPCPEVDGFLVSATALHKAAIQDVCQQENYLDAAAVPALVLPRGIRPAAGVPRAPTGFDLADAKIGDLVVAISPTSPAPVYGVVGDSGPERKLGEASVAMNGALGNITREPTNYQDVKQHWVVADATVLIFAGTRDVRSPYLTKDRIDHDAGERFAMWGGGSVEAAVARLRVCAAAIGK